jgi:hypothetical protein
VLVGGRSGRKAKTRDHPARIYGTQQTEPLILTPANAADLLPTEELLAEAGLGGEVARKLLGDLAYRSERLEEELAELGIALVTSEASARRPGLRQQIEIAFSSLKRVFGLGETLATTLVGLATRILRRR